MKRFDNYTSGIYFIFQNESDAPLYIGKSINIFSRVYQHGIRYFDYCKYLETISDSETLDFVERWLIWIFQPEWNVAGKGRYLCRGEKTIEERFDRFCEKNKEATPRKPRKLNLDTISEFVYATALEYVE